MDIMGHLKPAVHYKNPTHLTLGTPPPPPPITVAPVPVTTGTGTKNVIDKPINFFYAPDAGKGDADEGDADYEYAEYKVRDMHPTYPRFANPHT